MARKGKNRKNYIPKTKNSTKPKNDSKSKKLDLPAYKSSALTVYNNAYNNSFFKPEFAWNGLETEIAPTSTSHELWHFLRDINDETLYEDIIVDILKKMKIDEKIIWWELEKVKVSYADEEALVVKFK